MPLKSNKYNVVVIGAGPAGISTASLAAEAGLSTLIIGSCVGGLYSLSGSIQSNTLLHLSQQYERFRTSTISYVQFEGNPLSFSFDFKRAKKYADGIAQKVRKTFHEQMEKCGVEQATGSALFTGPDSLEVTLADGEKCTVTFDYAVVATGSKNRTLQSVSSKRILDIQSVLNLTTVPANIAIVGGGFVGCEIAAFFRRVGSHVTIVEQSDRLLAQFDPLVTKRYEDTLKKRGVDVLKGTKVKNIERVGNRSLLFLDNGQLECDEVFVAIGRVPNVDKLGLEKAGIALENGLIPIDTELRSVANKKIFVAGDATGGTMLVNWAYKSAEIVASNIQGRRREYSSGVIPRVIYLDPEIATVGMNEEVAKHNGYEVATIKYSFADLEKLLIVGAQKGFLKLVYDKSSKQILGADIIGHGAGELASMFALLIQSKITIEKISEYVFNHPTFAEVLTDIALKVK